MKRSIPVIAGALLLGTALSGCALLPQADVNHEKESSYATAAEMSASDFDLQTWIPRDATDVKIKIKTTAQARPIARFTLGASGLGKTCKPVVARPAAPQLGADWMPVDAAAKATHLCGDFAVIKDGTAVTAWDLRSPDAG